MTNANFDTLFLKLILKAGLKVMKIFFILSLYATAYNVNLTK